MFYQNYIKRMLDCVLSCLVLLALIPLMLVIAMLIKLDSAGPVLFTQKRLTKDGRVFTMYKFRTMIKNAEYMGTGLFNYQDDFRVTRMGRFLRKTSLDELPQLINIIKGDMSIVGPRPPVFYELGDYKDLSREYQARFCVRAGITGFAQVSGRNELSWDEKVRYDNRYIYLLNKYGILIDLKILVMTIVQVFTMKDIYEERREPDKRLSDEEVREREMLRVQRGAMGEEAGKKQGEKKTDE